MRDLDRLSDHALQESPNTLFVGQRLVYLPEVGSTNNEARRLAEAGAPEGTVVVTDHQTSGRGRLDRRWEAPRGSSLLISLVFRPAWAAVEMQRLTMICGLAVADAIESETGLRVGLKWPNDIVIGGRKSGGMLTDLELDGPKVKYAVVGLGLNVNMDPARLPGDLLVAATSLSHELGYRVERWPLLCALLEGIETRYIAIEAGHPPHDEWAARLVTLGQQVEVSSEGRVVTGVANGVDENGALLVRLADGGLELVMAGDVTLRA